METFTPEDYKMIAKAEQIRNASDYDDFYVASKSESIQQVQDAEYIVIKLHSLFQIRVSYKLLSRKLNDAPSSGLFYALSTPHRYISHFKSSCFCELFF